MNFWERNDYNNSQTAANNGFNAKADCGYSEDNVKEKLNEYSGKSEDQLMNDLASTVARMKKDGTFDISSLENLYNTASPFLNDEQRGRMRSIIDMLKV